MLCVGIGDGIVDRLCGALVVIEKIWGLDGEFLGEASIISIFLCTLRSKVGDSRSSRRIGRINLWQIVIGTGDNGTGNGSARSDSESKFDHEFANPDRFVRCKRHSNELSFVS